MPLRSEAIWLPDGWNGIQERQVAQAVSEYDPDLMLGQNRATGDWCAFLPGNRNSEGEPFPVFSFGPNLPHPDQAKRILFEHDVRRNGRELLDQLDRIYDREQKALADKAEEGREAVAEAIISNMREKGTHPYPQIQMSGRGKKNGQPRIRSAD